jgi:hypothetical protein
MSQWCTVTVTDVDGRRHSIDVLADSSYDAASLFLAKAAFDPDAGLPQPTIDTVFQVIAGWRMFRVHGTALERWTIDQRQTLGGEGEGLSYAGPELESSFSERER